VELTSIDASQTALQDTVRSSSEGLRTLAEGTGGRYFVRASDAAIAAIEDASSTYYLLTYSSPAPEDGKSHSIEVRLSRSDLKVPAGRARTSDASVSVELSRGVWVAVVTVSEENWSPDPGRKPRP